MTIKVQEAPQAPSYEATGIQVPANIATPQAAMDSVKNQQVQLNSVNNLTGGRRKRSRQNRHLSKYQHKSFIRTYKGRRYVSQDQKGGSSQGGAQIAIPQVGSTCSGARKLQFHKWVQHARVAHNAPVRKMRILLRLVTKHNPTVSMMRMLHKKEGVAIIP